MTAAAAATQILKAPGVKPVLIYGGLGLLAIYLVPRAVPAVIKAVVGAVGGLVTGTVGAVSRLAGEGIRAVNPLNQDNIFYEDIVNNVGRGATGDEHFTLGGFVFDLFHEEYDPNAVVKGKAAIEAVERVYPHDPAYRPQVRK